MMYRRNYGRRSGVIIDICKKHGAWFDADELPRILSWIRSGGLAQTNEARAADAAREARVKERVESLPDPFGKQARPMGLSGIPTTRLGVTFIDEIVDWLFRP
jgi:Zn-finger nucleic acid-binding protein